MCIRDRRDHAVMAARWQRLPLLGLLWPLLWLQAWHVRRITPRMPEPPGRRAGTAGHGSLIRLLVAGDSGAAGVGAPTQDQALCGHLVRRLSRHHTVQWCVLAVNGLDSPGLLLRYTAQRVWLLACIAWPRDSKVEPQGQPHPLLSALGSERPSAVSAP